MSRFVSLFSVASVAVASLGATAVFAVAFAAPAGAATASAGTYAAVTPFRVVNTATGAYKNHKGAITHGHSFTATVGGHGGVPKKAAAVAVTISAVSPTASGGLIAYAAGSTRPGVQNLLFSKGRNVAMSAIVRVSSSGKITIYNSAHSGKVQVTVDVSGYYLAGTPSSSTAGVLHTVTPKQVYSKTVGKHATVAATVGGHAGVPKSGVGTVAVLITASAPAKAGLLTAYATGHARPTDPTVHLAAKMSITQFAIIPMGSNGQISIYNSAASSVKVSVAVLAYSVSGIITTAGTITPRTEARVVNGSKIAANATRTVAIGGHDGVPLTHVSAVIATISIAAPAKKGNVVAWKAGSKRPGVTNLQFAAGQTASDYAVIPVSSKGTIAVRNSSSGAARLYIDINGYVQSNTITAPHTSVGRYVRNVGGSFADPSSDGDGCADAKSTLVLLEFGAQSNNKKGVVLTATNTPVKYGALVTALRGYLHSFASCSPPAHAVVALGTNNDGSFSKYAATARGKDWANKVVDAVGTFAGVTVAGANDIEPGFASTEAQAQQWETAYLGATSTSLIFNGSADGCSTTFGSHADCNYGWTLKQLYALAHNGKRIRALPQVYTAGQAVQWANIDAAGGKAITFAGSLTENKACPKTSSACTVASYKPAEGWAALQHAIATVVAAPSIAAATDLRVSN